MPADAIVDSRLWVRLSLDNSVTANSLFQTDPANRAHLAAQLLLYDSVVIPTKDFGIVPMLMSWMGESAFRQALEENAICFLRPKGLLGYAGNGNGICGFGIFPTPARPFDWWQAALFGPMEDAIRLQLEKQCPSLTRSQRDSLSQSVSERSKSFELGNEQFMEFVANESYTDIMRSPSLTAFVLAHQPAGSTPIGLSRLVGVGENQVRVLNAEELRDAIDLVLRVAEINLEIMMAHSSGKADLGTSEGAEVLLRGKLARAGATPQLVDEFQSLLELNDIPDIRQLVASDQVTLAEIWMLRQRPEAKRFRRWLRDAEPEDARDLEKAFVATLSRSSVYSSLPVRAIRFVITKVIGSLDPCLGFAVSGLDSFFIQQWLAGYSPRLFLDRIRRLPSGDRPRQ